MKRKSTSTPRGPDGRFTKKARAARIQPAGDDGSPASVRTAPEVSATTGSKARLAVREEDVVRENVAAPADGDLVHSAQEDMEIDTDSDLKSSKAARDDCFRVAIANMADIKRDMNRDSAEDLPANVIALVQEVVKDFAKQANRPVGFLALPLELRRQIYRECLVRFTTVRLRCLPDHEYSHRLIYVPECDIPPQTDHYIPEHLPKNYRLIQQRDGQPAKRTKNDRNKSLLLVSKQISEEALDVLYGENIFEHETYQHEYYTHKERFHRFSLTNQYRIRKMRIVFSVPRCRLGLEVIMEPFFWEPVLARLTRLEVLLLEPLVPLLSATGEIRLYSSYGMYQAKSYAQEWLNWLPNHLKYIAKAVSPSILFVDDGAGAKSRSTGGFVVSVDGVEYIHGVPGAETRNIARSQFGGKYKEFRSVEGDLHYGRRIEEEEVDEEDMAENDAAGGAVVNRDADEGEPVDQDAAGEDLIVQDTDASPSGEGPASDLDEDVLYS